MLVLARRGLGYWPNLESRKEGQVFLGEKEGKRSAHLSEKVDIFTFLCAAGNN